MMVVSSGFAWAQPKRLLERAFFHFDIYNFLGRPYRSPSFGEAQSIAQPFLTQCSNLNRIILPFYKERESVTGILEFNLYLAGGGRKKIFSTFIDTSTFPAPTQIGTHPLDGILRPIWFPAIPDSKGRVYLWELKTGEGPVPRGLGLYLTRMSDPQVEEVRINGKILKNAFTAFYSYCSFRFDWEEIAGTIWSRLRREGYFFGFYLMLMAGVVIGLKKTA
ncbi:MAG: hypothetical protein ACE5G9_12485 [Nitrospinales bacterium]